MTVTNIDRNFDTLTLTVTADFDAPVEQVWDLWADPRKLERWWGPPTYPATVKDHDLTPGGDVTYFMTGPEGDEHHGWWRIDSVEPPTALDFSDGFADADGKPVDELPVTTMSVRLSQRDGGTRMEMRSSFDTREQMEQLDKMGMTEGLQLAMGQMDGILAGLARQVRQPVTTCKSCRSTAEPTSLQRFRTTLPPSSGTASPR